MKCKLKKIYTFFLDDLSEIYHLCLSYKSVSIGLVAISIKFVLVALNFENAYGCINKINLDGSRPLTMRYIIHTR